MPTFRIRLLVSCFLAIGLTSAVLLSGEPLVRPEPVEFNRQIRSILADNCFTCHGPDRGKRKADLRLDVESAAHADRGGYRAIAPGVPEQSELYRRLTSDEEGRMPPPKTGKKLSSEQIRLIRRWIEQGGKYQPHWAFVPLKMPAVPSVQQRSWGRNPIDNFVLARLEQENLRPAEEAAKTTLLRRVSLDLTGLPPSRQETEAFLRDDSPEAYEKVVDRLLQSPHFGERMALDWLDASRYADTNGYFSDLERQQWPWRDWVINAFNRNMPFDQFTIEQLAGDLLPGATREQKIATGFNRNHTVNNESGIIEEEYRVEYVADRLETSATVWMGLTIGCARCHDHKFDPISQKEYYRLFAFFNNVPERGLAKGNIPPALAVPTPSQEQSLTEAHRRRSEKEQVFQKQEKRLLDAMARWERAASKKMPRPPATDLATSFDFDNHLADANARGSIAYEPGVRGAALSLGGAGHVEAASDLGLDAGRPWTLSLWFRPQGGETPIIGSLLSKMAAQEQAPGFDLLWRKGRLQLSLVQRRGASALDVLTRKALATGQWHHVAIVYDGSRKAAGLRVFIDGLAEELHAQEDDLQGPITNEEPLRIGWKATGLGYYGQLDELRVYRRTCTESEVASLYWGDFLASVLRKEPAKRTRQEKQQLTDYYITHEGDADIRSAWQELNESRRQEEEITAAIPTMMVMEEMNPPRETFVLERGQYDKHGQKVQPNVPACLPPLPTGAGRNRLTLARWLVSPDNPLTSRVIVNRFWQRFFGEGLVATGNDFGTQGEAPSHPELLDWLAVQFLQGGWDVKAILKQIVLSSTYRQSSALTPELLRRDPANRLLARGSRFRLPAEVIRDQALALGGLLVPKIGGPSVKPYQPAGLWEAVAFNDGGELRYVQDHGASLYRKTLYTYWKRQAPPPATLSFDGPTREVCTVKRSRTNTPLQALVLLNDPTYVESARGLAARLMRCGTDPVERIRFGFGCATGRAPQEEETEMLLGHFRRQCDVYRQKPKAAIELLGVGESARDRKLDLAELAAWTSVASVLLNLDETINRE